MPHLVPIKGYGIVLCCVVLCCVVLCCVVLCCVVLYCIVLYCIVLYCIVLYCRIFKIIKDVVRTTTNWRIVKKQDGNS